MRASSSSPSERLAPGTVVAGFRIAGVLGAGRRGIVYEAQQVGLDRRVALRLLAPALSGDAHFALAFRAQRWPEHAGIVPMYAAGTSEHGLFVASRLLHGPTLADAGREHAATLLEQVAEALDAAHADGIAHGALSAHNVLVDPAGRALIADFGLAPGAATPAQDRAAFAALARELLGATPAAAASARALLPPRQPGDGRIAGRAAWPRRAVAGLAAGAAVAAAFALARGDSEQRAPAPPTGALSLGAALAGGAASVDCAGAAPSGNSDGCTVVPVRLNGRPLTAARDGAVRRWTVRGARGSLSLQVIRRRGTRYALATRSQEQVVPDAGVHSFRVDLAIRRGDLVGLELAPGSAVGVRREPGAATLRWIDALGYDPRRPTLGAGTGLDRAVLLRVDYLPGVRHSSPPQLTGDAAAAAPAGRELAGLQLEEAGRPRRIALVRLPAGVALDLFVGRRRVARRSVPDADPRGAPVRLANRRLNWPGPHLEWRNPDGRTVVHNYLPGARSIRPLD